MSGYSPHSEVIRQKVKDQYEKYPYPAGDADLHEFVAKHSCQGGCPSVWFHWYWPYATATDDLDILIAGCGTSQAPQFALNLSNSRHPHLLDSCDMTMQKMLFRGHYEPQCTPLIASPFFPAIESLPLAEASGTEPVTPCIYGRH